MAWSTANLRATITIIIITFMVGIYNYIPETIQFVSHAVKLQSPTEYTQHAALNDRTEGVDNLI